MGKNKKSQKSKPGTEGKSKTKKKETTEIAKTTEKLEHELPRRKSKEDIIAAGILKEESPAKAAEKKQELTETVEKIIQERPNQEEIAKHKEHIVNPTGANRRLSGNLASAARDLDRQMTANKLDRQLAQRPQEQELKEQGVLHDAKVAPGLQANQEKLQKQMNADQVHQLLHNRPSATEIQNQGLIEKPQVAPRLMATAKALERHIVQDQMEHLLGTRPEADELVTQNLVDDVEIAPAIQGPMHKLQYQLKKDNVSKLLQRRPSREDLKHLGVYQSDGTLPTKQLNEPPNENGLSARVRYAIALKAASRLARENLIDSMEKARLKNLILSDDNRILAAVECFELDHNAEEMLDTFYRIGKLA